MLVLIEAERTGKVSRRQERQEATLYTTLEPCALCMDAAMSFLLGKIVFAAEAPVDGGTNLPDLWQPPNGHPSDGMPYTIPEVVGGVGREASIALMAEWVRRNPQQKMGDGVPPDRVSLASPAQESPCPRLIRCPEGEGLALSTGSGNRNCDELRSLPCCDADC
jgi:hypothetical protein